VGELDPEAFDAALAEDPEAAAALLADLAVATDAQLRAAARRIAGRVFLQLGRVGPAKARGTRRLGPSRGLDGDLDLDRTLDRWDPGRSGRPAPEDLVTRTWTAHRRAVCLLVDISGSMHGLAVALAAVAAAGVVVANEEGTAARLEPSVVAFGAEVRVLQPQGVRRPPEDLLSDLVALRGHGTTDLAAGLREASTQLAGAVADERLAVLLSDCLHTTGDDPAEALGGIDRLHVLVPLGGAEAEAAAFSLAARGGGRAHTVRRLADVAPALTRILA
jgi:Mg-chelatase subunit ChlD